MERSWIYPGGEKERECGRVGGEGEVECERRRERKDKKIKGRDREEYRIGVTVVLKT